MKLFTITAAIAAATGLAACSKPPTPAPIVAAERAFAADGYDRGVKASFLAFAADDAVMFAPGPVNARETLSKLPDLNPDAKQSRLSWRPRWAGIARSGDLGFTTGPYAVDGEPRGYYFTVWKKQPDGVWKWALDAGVGADAAADGAEDSDPDYLPLGARGAESADAAIDEVREDEASLARTAESDAVAAYAAFLADEARLHDEGAPPAITKAARLALLKARPSGMKFSYLGGGASKAGDFVWTYGDVASTNGGERGWYARVWQKQDDGWRIVFDEFVPAPEENAP